MGGGVKPHVLAVIDSIKPRDLYHAVRESVTLPTSPRTNSTGAKNGANQGAYPGGQCGAQPEGGAGESGQPKT